jgi:hypothetical protein
MASQSQSLGSLINLKTVLPVPAAQPQALSNILLLSPNSQLNVNSFITYDSLASVAADYGTTDPIYYASDLIFAAGGPTVSVALWAQLAQPAVLVGSPLTATASLTSTWTAITSGGFDITINGTPYTLTSLNFSGVTNLNGVASVINTELTGATITYNSVYNQFKVTDVITGTSSTISFATAPSSGTDISGLLGLVVGNGSQVIEGIAAETPVTALARNDLNYGLLWYSAYIIGATDAQNVAAAEYIQGSSNVHALLVPNQDTATQLVNDQTNVSYQLEALELGRAWSQYSSTSPYAITSIAAQLQATNFAGQNTAINTMWKQEPGVVAESLPTNVVQNVKSYNANILANVASGIQVTPVFQNGVTASGQYLDTAFYADAVQIYIQNALLNLVLNTGTKIGQTAQGNNDVQAVVVQTLTAFQNQGFIAQNGYWDGGTVGPVVNKQFLPTGFWVDIPPIQNQSQLNLDKRNLSFQVGYIIQGAVNTFSAVITVSNPGTI